MKCCSEKIVRAIACLIVGVVFGTAAIQVLVHDGPYIRDGFIRVMEQPGFGVENARTSNCHVSNNFTRGTPQ
jgi:hypothetical protein